MRLRLATYNLLDYGAADRRDAEEHARYKLVEEVVRQLVDEHGVGLITVQEVCGGGAHGLLDLAEATGLECHYRRPIVDEDGGQVGRIAVAAAGGQRPVKHHVGLLWDPAVVAPVPDTWREYGAEMWHNLAICTFNVHGYRVRVGSYHGPPFGRGRRCDEAERVVSAMTRPYSEQSLSIVGADWNSISADKVRDPDGTWRYWHPDPYADQPWTEPFIYQCEVEDEEDDGRPRRWRADRRPGQVFVHAGIRDTAALAGAPWAPTVGHFGHADMGFRTIDTFRVTPTLAEAVVRHEVVDTELTRAASDHLPVVVTLDLDRL